MRQATPREILKTVFGFDAFRPGQEEIISHILDGGDALALMPTGGGKSVCYQIPALLRPGPAVVVSPLIALMQDQVAGLLQAGVRAATLNSSLAAEAQRAVFDGLRAGELDVLYLAPERLMQPGFLDFLAGLSPSLLAIDEAHCVSQWGHDFRPEYRQLAVLAERFPGVPRLALTATADAITRDDILRQLDMESARVFAQGFDRPNIRYTVVPKDHPGRQLLDFIRREHPGESGIVYRMTRKGVEATAAQLNKNGVPALAYHAGLSSEERRLAQEAFMREDGLVMVATVAFGMGVDKPDVRFVAHLEPPKSLEAYHQETGRAGRDGLPADAWMTYGLQDVVALRKNLGVGEGDEPHKKVERLKLHALLGFCETAGCRRCALLDYFGEPPDAGCGNCDTCLHPVDAWDGTVAAQKALSAIYRTGEQFGSRHLIDVLLGRDTPAMAKWGHDQLPTFGVGTELDQDGWRSVFRQLTALGDLDFEIIGHGRHVLRLNAESWAVLRGEKEVRLRRDAKPPRRKTTRTRRPRALDDLTDERQVELFERLRGLRKELAERAGVPPYVIFHDRTLMDMVLRQPTSLTELGEIGGVGKGRLDKHGRAFLDELLDHYRAHGVDPDQERRDEPARPKSKLGAVERTLDVFGQCGDLIETSRRRGLKPSTAWKHLSRAVERGELGESELPDKPGGDARGPSGGTAGTSLHLFRECGDAREVADKRGMAESTIWNHLAKAAENGRLSPDEVGLSPEDVERIREASGAIARDEPKPLTRLRDELGRAYDFGPLRVALAFKG